MIYFVRQGEYVKIGYSKEPKKRIKDIQTFAPEQLETLLIIDGQIKNESALHEKFEANLSFGEWFHYCDDIKQYIEDNSSNNKISDYYPVVKSKTHEIPLSYYKTDYKERYKAMKKGLKLNNSDIASITGNTASSTQVVTSRSSNFPRWAKLAVWVYEYFTSVLEKWKDREKAAFMAGCESRNEEYMTMSYENAWASYKPAQATKEFGEALRSLTKNN